MTRMRGCGAFVTLIVGAGVLLGGCGGDSTNPAASATPATPSAAATPGAEIANGPVDPCGLLSPGDLSGIFAGESFRMEPAPGGNCAFIGDGQRAVDTIHVTVSTQTKTLFQSIKGNSQGTKDTAGIGDQAYYVQDTPTLVRLYLLKGTNAVNITLDTAGDSAVAAKTPAATRLTAIQKVGKAVAGRLP